MEEFKSGSYTYMIQVPVKVSYSKENGRISIDAVQVPEEAAIYALVDKEAAKIKDGAKLRVLFDKTISQK